MYNIFAIAIKYNDVFYAQFTSEWLRSDRKVLIYLDYYDNFDKVKSLAIDIFDKIIVVNPKKLSSLMKLLPLMSGKKERSMLITSNINLLINKFIYKLIRPRSIILVEDGVMSYVSYPLIETNNAKKKIIQNILFINDQAIFKKISKLYLLEPSLAELSFEIEVEKLTCEKIYTPKHIVEHLNNKKIFIGQPLYNIKYLQLTVEKYSSYVNSIIVSNEIDIYIPHPHFDSEERISIDSFNLSDYGFTLEMLLVSNELLVDIYSFYSSVLISSKAINPNVKSTAVTINEIRSCSEAVDNLKLIPGKKFVEKHVNSIINL